MKCEPDQLGPAHLSKQLTETDCKSNKVAITILFFSTSFPRFAPSIACIWIRRFEINFNIYTWRPRARTLESGTAWGLLVRTNRVDCARAALQQIRPWSNSQTHFPNLHKLYLNFRIRTDPTDLVRYTISPGTQFPPTFRCISDFIAAVLDALQHCERCMQAKKVVIHVYCVGCRNMGQSRTRPVQVTEYQTSPPPCMCEH